MVDPLFGLTSEYIECAGETLPIIDLDENGDVIEAEGEA
jgi:hypothetical protein